MQRFLGISLLLVCAFPAAAQKPPAAGYMYPPVVRIGTMDVEIGGYDWTRDVQVFMHDQRIRIETSGPLSDFFVPSPPYWFGEKGRLPAFPLPRELPVKIHVPEGIQPGLYRWQIANANGPAEAATFLISDLRETLESRYRNDPQAIGETPVGVSGRLSRISEIDRYLISTETDGVHEVRVSARRLGANMNAVLTLRDSSGKKIIDAADTLGQDLRIKFQATAGEEYELAIHDLDFRGHRSFIYHLSVSPSKEELPAAGIASGKLALPTNDHDRINVGSEKTYDVILEKGQWITVAAHPITDASSLDLELSIQHSTGGKIVTVDDTGSSRDPVLHYRASQDGVHRLTLRDLQGFSERMETVHLIATRQEPGFTLSMPQTVAIPLEGSATLAIKATRTGGFQGPITLRLDGLPTGVTLNGDAIIPEKKTDAKLTLAAAGDASVTATRLRIVGQATVDGKAFSTSAQCLAAGNLCPQHPQDQQVDFALLAVTMKPRFQVKLVDRNRQRAVHRGTTYPAPFVIQREEGYKAPITLQMASKQGRHRQGIRGPSITFPSGTTEAAYPCFMPEWLATDRTSRMVVHAVADVLDPAGNPRRIMTAADARVTMILEGALMKLAHGADEIEVNSGESISVPVSLARSVKLSQAANITVELPVELEGLVTAQSLRLGPSEDSGTLVLKTQDDPALHGDWTIQIVATAKQEGRWPVVSQTDLLLSFPR